MDSPQPTSEFPNMAKLNRELKNQVTDLLGVEQVKAGLF
jgi:hypothetical protein